MNNNEFITFNDMYNTSIKKSLVAFFHKDLYTKTAAVSLNNNKDKVPIKYLLIVFLNLVDVTQVRMEYNNKKKRDADYLIMSKIEKET